MIYQRVACYACGVVVSLCKTAVDDHEPAACLDGILPLGSMHGHMTVDDVSVVALHPESVEYPVAHLGLLAQRVVVAFLLVVGALVLQHVALKGGHAVFVEER